MASPKKSSSRSSTRSGGSTECSSPSSDHADEVVVQQTQLPESTTVTMLKSPHGITESLQTFNVDTHVETQVGTIRTRGSVHHEDEVRVNTIYAEMPRSLSEEHDGRRRVVNRIVRQQPRLVHHEEHIVEEPGRIVNEYQFEEQVPVDYHVVREDVVEHIVVVPVTEEVVKKEVLPPRIVEVEKKVPIKKIVEVDTVEVVETIKEIPTPSGRTQKKVNYIPRKKVVPQDKYVTIERPIEKVVDVPDITYVDVEEIIETVEVPEYQDVIRVKEVPIPQIVEVPREIIEERTEVADVEVLIPVGVKAHSTVEYTVPTIVEKRSSRGYPVYVPRFIEVPRNAIELTNDQRAKSKKLLSQMKELEASHLEGHKIVSVCEIEKMGVAARDHQTCIQGHIDSSDIKSSLLNVFGTRGVVYDEEEDVLPTKELRNNEGYYGHTTHTSGHNWGTIAYETKAGGERDRYIVG